MGSLATSAFEVHYPLLQACKSLLVTYTLRYEERVKGRKRFSSTHTSWYGVTA